MGLLILRAAVGITAALQGAHYLANWSNASFAMLLATLLVLAGGLLLVIGLLTKVAGALVCVYALLIASSWLPVPASNLLDTRLPIVLVMSVAGAIVFLGPGAFSVDARLFGRREIVIPRQS